MSPQPYPAAVERLAGKTPVASQLTSAQWAQMPDALRERAFFSARVDDLRMVAEMQSRIDDALSVSVDATTAFTDRSKFVSEMRGLLGAAPGDSGDLTDIASRRRLELVYDFQKEESTEFARWNAAQDEELLDSFPAQELVRVRSSEVERDWLSRWRDAGGPTPINGRMIARKDDPVWTNISRFNRPWPPFDFGSGMGLEDIPRDEAEELGVIRRNEKPESQLPGYNKALAASLPDASPVILEAFQELFGDQVSVDQGGLIQWRATS